MIPEFVGKDTSVVDDSANKLPRSSTSGSVEVLSQYGGAERQANLPSVVDGDTWRLPAASILAGSFQAKTVIPGNPPVIADDICQLLEATSNERSLLNSALREAFQRVQMIEAEHLKIEENE